MTCFHESFDQDGVINLAVPVFNPGDIVEMKKEHPCGGKQWEIVRTGIDFRIKCMKCQHQVMVPRIKFEKSVKKIIK